MQNFLTVKILEYAINQGFQITYDLLKDFDATKVNILNSDLVIVSNTFLCSYEYFLLKFLIESKVPFVKYEHDYSFCQIRNAYCFVDSKFNNCCHAQKYKIHAELYSNALLNVFLSPLHYDVIKRYYGNSVNKYIIMPSPIDIDGIKVSLKKEYKCVFIGDLTQKKGGEALIEYANRNTYLEINVFGRNFMEKDLPFNIKLNKIISNKEILVVLGKSESFFFKPKWLEPFGRVAMEAFLSDCKMIVNNNIGALHFDFYPNNKLKAIEQTKNAPAHFWNSIINNLNQSKKIKASKNILFFKSYGGLGDVFISLPAILKVSEKYKNITYAVSYGLADFFQSKIPQINFINFKDVESLNVSFYDEIIDLSNYPAFKLEKQSEYGIDYPTHERIYQHAAKHYIDGLKNIFPKIKNSYTSYPYLPKNLANKTYFTIHTGAGFLPKCWPIESYNTLINYIFNLYPNIKCYAIIGENDPDNFKNVEKKENLIVVKDSLSKVGEILSGAKFHIGNDSGITHFSSIFNIPVVTIHGPSGPGTWVSLAEKRELIWGKKNNCDLMCNYHTANNCTHRNCLTKVDVDTVFERVCKLLSKAYTKKSSYILNPKVELKKQKSNTYIINQEKNEFFLEIFGQEEQFILDSLIGDVSSDFSNINHNNAKLLIDTFIEQKLTFSIPNENEL